MSRKVLVFVSVVVMLMFTASSVLAVAAKFHSSSGAVNNNGALVVSFDERGLGEGNIDYTLTAIRLHQRRWETSTGRQQGDDKRRGLGERFVRVQERSGCCKSDGWPAQRGRLFLSERPEAGVRQCQLHQHRADGYDQQQLHERGRCLADILRRIAGT
jgi:hypothetical protein